MSWWTPWVTGRTWWSFARSLGGFTAPLGCARLPADLLVLATAMIPRPDE